MLICDTEIVASQKFFEKLFLFFRGGGGGGVGVFLVSKVSL